jgi:hypothetical protein
MARLVGPGIIGPPGPTSDIYTTPFPVRPGDKARDKDGNEYVFCAFVTSNVSGGVLVSIDSSYNAAPLLGTARLGSRVGIAMTGATATTNGGWVQIYGLHLAVQVSGATDSDGGSANLSSDQSVNYWLIPQTSVTTPSGTLAMVLTGTGTSIAESSTEANLIWGMWLVPAAEVSAIEDAKWIDMYPLVTSPVSAVSATSGAVTLISGTTNGTSMHTGTTRPIYLNYPYVNGLAQSYGVATTG